MKALIFSLIFLTITSFGDELPGTANSFRDINLNSTPIVTNAEEAVYAAISPIGVNVKTKETDDAVGNLKCYPNRMNVITNNVDILNEYDELEVTFISNFRSGKIYFGPEYQKLIDRSPDHNIKLRPDKLLFNGSTNIIYITKIPAVISLTQFLDTNLWVTVEYPVFEQ